ncbi:MAG: NUDIX domain-containing protein [Anaerolineae bacterium]|nr:NUDIX domain-containing protein [Anaerolineae bacterium]
MRIVRKAYAYVTRGNHLLIFRHPDFPDAGLQVPGGSINPDETSADAALREAYEETGLTQLRLGVFLGEQQRDLSDFGKAELHHRYFYHVWCEEDTPAKWQHHETDPSDDPIQRPIRFEFFWVALPDGVPPLIAGHDAFLPALIAHLGL